MRKKIVRHIVLALYYICLLRPLVGYANHQLSITHSVTTAQRVFIHFMRTKIEKANQQVLNERRAILAQCHHPLSTQDKVTLRAVASRYRLTLTFDQPGDCNLLLEHVDSVPNSIALAQAINESAWGTSRFAKQGHNFFGQWCYTPGCGIKPLQVSGRYHEVTKFKRAQDSVEHYLYNLNTHPAYKVFRHLRAQFRKNGKPVHVKALLATLKDYSALGKEYIQRIDYIIDRYDL